VGTRTTLNYAVVKEHAPIYFVWILGLSVPCRFSQKKIKKIIPNAIEDIRTRTQKLGILGFFP
jgi:hypothetical protein